MKKVSFLLVLVLAFLVTGLAIGAQMSEKIGVAVTIAPLAEFVEQVGGERVSVYVMVPPGGNPHTYEPTPGQLKEVDSSMLYVKVGSGVEFEIAWLDKLLALNKKLIVCDSGRGIRLIAMAEHHHNEEPGHDGGHHHGGTDPHIWNSLSNAIIMVGNIRDSLIGLDPVHAQEYRENAAAYIVKLSRLKKQLAKQLGTVKNKKFMVFHPSFAYFAADFGLHEIAVEVNGKEPSAGELAQLIDEAKEEKIKTIFASPQFSDKSAGMISQAIGGRVVFIDPLARDYLENIKQVGNILSEK